MMHRRPRVLVDVDDVLCDFNSVALWIATEVTGASPAFVPSDFHGWDIAKDHRIQPHAEEIWKRINERQGLIRTLQPLPGAVEGIHRIGMFAEVYVCTSSVDAPHYHKERIEWLHEHLGVDRKHIIFSHAKYMAHAEFLIDDRPDNVFTWVEQDDRRTGLLWVNEMNKWDMREHPRVVKLEADWRRAEEIIRKAIP